MEVYNLSSVYQMRGVDATWRTNVGSLRTHTRVRTMPLRAKSSIGKLRKHALWSDSGQGKHDPRG
jgi:hypothetical protein